MNVAASPVATGDGVALNQTRQHARCATSGNADIAVDAAVPEPDRILLSKCMVDENGVLVLMLNIRIGVDRVAVGCGVEGASRGIYRLDETNQPGINQASGDYVVGERLARKPRRGCSRGSSKGVIELLCRITTDAGTVEAGSTQRTEIAT